MGLWTRRRGVLEVEGPMGRTVGDVDQLPGFQHVVVDRGFPEAGEAHEVRGEGVEGEAVPVPLVKGVHLRLAGREDPPICVCIYISIYIYIYCGATKV